MKVKPLPTQFEKAPGSLPSRFTQVKRNEYAAIYRRDNPKTGELISFEVFEVRVGEPNEFVGRKTKEELYPSNTCFGRWAWDTDEAGAEIIFDQITKGKGKRLRPASEMIEVSDVEDEPEVEVSSTKSKPKAIKVNVKKKTARRRGGRGRKAVARPAIKFPSKSEWCMKDLLAVNKGWTQPTLYIALKGMAKVQESSRRKVKAGKGRPTVFYKLK